MPDRKATLTAVLVDSVSGPAKKIQAEITGIGSTASKTTALLQGIGQGIGEHIFDAISRGIETISRTIPDLIEKGNSYLAQLHMIQLETGMTAEQASLLVGQMVNLGVPTSAIDVLFARLGKNLGANEGNFRALGVATRDSNGAMLSSAQIIENLRATVQSHGESLLSTAAAMQLFGRAGYEILPFLHATSEELATATENTRRWGGVISQDAIDGARKFEITLASLGQGITDIGAQIASAVDPYLRAFVDSFAKFVQSHLQEIINFAVAVVNTITGFISGLFGITNSLTVSTDAVAKSSDKAASSTDNFGKTLKSAGAGSDAFTTSINSQIKAIDAHIAALTAAAERRRAIQERDKLEATLANARSQLVDLQGTSPFVAGLSNAEQQLALEKHAQDILNAKKAVSDATVSLGNFEADQKDRAERALLEREKQRLQESLAAHKAANAAILTSGLRMGAGLQTDFSKVVGNLGIKAEEFGKTAAASFKTGVDAAKGFLDILLGSVQQSTHPGTTFRTGGVVGALRGIGDAFSALFSAIGSIPKAISDIDNAFRPLSDALNGIAGAANRAGQHLHDLLPPLTNLADFLFAGLPGYTPAPQHAAGGWVGLNGPELGWLGERGPEYIVKNGDLGKMGGQPIIVNFNSTWPPTLAQGREILDFIDRGLYVRTSNTAVGRA